VGCLNSTIAKEICFAYLTKPHVPPSGVSLGQDNEKPVGRDHLPDLLNLLGFKKDR